MTTPRKGNKQPKGSGGEGFVEIPLYTMEQIAQLPGKPVPEGFELVDMDDPRAVAAWRARETAAGLREQVKPPGGGSFPAITIPVHITAEEHAAIARFCEANRITVAEFVTLRGVGFDMKEFEEDAINRAQLLGEAAERFGGGWSVEPNPETHSVTVEFSRPAFMWLQAMTAYDGYASPADRIRASVAGDVASLAEAITEGEIRSIFEVPERESAEALAAAADRDDLPLAAAGKPQKRKA